MKLRDKLTGDLCELTMNDGNEEEMDALEAKINRLQRVIDGRVPKSEPQMLIPLSTPFGTPGGGQYLRTRGKGIMPSRLSS